MHFHLQNHHKNHQIRYNSTMKNWLLIDCKCSSYCLIIIFSLVILMVAGVDGGCIEEERQALLEIKSSLKSHGGDADHLLPTWTDHSRLCCEWERVKCNSSIGHVTHLDLKNLRRIVDENSKQKIWELNVSVFLHFKELRNLNLGFNYLDNGIEKTGLRKLSNLKKLEILDLGSNNLESNSIFNSLGALTSLKFLNLSDNALGGHFPAQELAALENLETLDLTYGGFYGTFEMQGLERLPRPRKLEILNLGHNKFNESILPSLSAFPSLKVLNLQFNSFSGSFPAKELANLNSLENLDLSSNYLNDTSTIQDCRRLSSLKRLESIDLGKNMFNKSIILCLSAIPSLKILDLQSSIKSGNSFPVQELSVLKELTTLDLSNNTLDSLELNDCERLSSLNFLESIVLANNKFNSSIISCLSALPSLKSLDLHGNSINVQELSIMRELTTLDLSNSKIGSLELINGTMSSLVHLNLDGNNLRKEVLRSFAHFTSLKFLSLAHCNMEGMISAEDLPKLPDLGFLILRHNRFNGTLPMEGLAYFRHLELLDLGFNLFVGSIPSSIKALSSLKELSLAGNELNGSLPLQGFCELTNLRELDLSENKFEGALPPCFSRLSSLKKLDLNRNNFSRNIPSSLISNLTSLEYIDLGYNNFEGVFSMSSFSNLTKIQVIRFLNDNDKFEVETQEPLGWIPMFQLKVLVISNCNMNRSSRSVPSFLLHQRELHIIDLSQNSLGGPFPNWLIENNTRLECLNLENNFFGGTIRMAPYRNHNTWLLDMSDNRLTGSIPPDIGNILPYITNLNLSHNSLDGVLPLSMGDLSEIELLDLSNNNFYGEVPRRLLTADCPRLTILQLSNNKLEGEVLSRNFSTSRLQILLLDNNRFTGVLTSEIIKGAVLYMLDISDNLFSGVIPGWIANLTSLNALIIRNNTFEGQFPCGKAPFQFLDISQNSFSGSLPSCLNLQGIKHLHLDSNSFSGSIPESFSNLTSLLSLDMGNNKISGRIPNFLGEFSSLRILILGTNDLSGSIPKQLCQLSNVSWIDLSGNSLSGSIPNCLQNTTGPKYLAFQSEISYPYSRSSSYQYPTVLQWDYLIDAHNEIYEKQVEVQFTTKSRPDTYKGGILDYMSGLDLSSNNLRGEIPKELGLLTRIRALNLSHNQLTGPIPTLFSNLSNIESLDLSSNNLSGRIPSELLALNFLSTFIVANNNLSGRLPEFSGQFATFSANSYEGNPFLCGLPLEKKCTPAKPNSTLMSVEETEEKWYDVDAVFFGASLVSTWFVILMGFAGVLYVNPNWRRRWFDFVEQCMFKINYFLRKCSCKFRF